MEENRENVKISEKIEKLNQKMKELEEMIEQSPSSLDDALLNKLGLALGTLLLGLEKAIDAMKSLVNRFNS